MDLSPAATARLFAALIALLLVGLFALSIDRAGKVDPLTGTLTMRYSLPLRITGWLLGVAVPLGFIVLLFFVPFQKPQDPWIAGGMLTFFTLVGGGVLLQTHRFRVVVSGEGVECRSLWGRRFLAWGDIRRVTSSTNSSFLTLRGPGRARITMPRWLTGLRTFAERLVQRLDPEVYAGALLAFAQLGLPPLPLRRHGSLPPDDQLREAESRGH
jgi:hypothetical protein